MLVVGVINEGNRLHACNQQPKGVSIMKIPLNDVKQEARPVLGRAKKREVGYVATRTPATATVRGIINLLRLLRTRCATATNQVSAVIDLPDVVLH